MGAGCTAGADRTERMEPMSGPAGTQRGDRARAGTDVAGVARDAEVLSGLARPLPRVADDRVGGLVAEEYSQGTGIHARGW